QAEDGIRDGHVTGVQTCALPICTPELTASLTPVRIAGFELNFNNWLYYLAWSIAMIGYVIGWLILRGRTGRAFRAVRDSETAAEIGRASCRERVEVAGGAGAVNG